MDMALKYSENKIYPSDENTRDSYLPTLTAYQSLYDQSIEDSDQFWMDVTKDFYWKSQPKNVFAYNFDIRKGPIFIKFMEGALFNVCFNVLDRYIDKGKGEQIAYHWEGNDGKSKRRITYTELRREVCKFANALKGLHIKKGDRIAIYMPVSIECVVAMLACARIGAVHSVMFAGFSAEALAFRIMDANCALLICADGCYRANKLIALKDIADSALDICRQRGYQKLSNIVNKHLSWSSIEKDINQDCNHEWSDQVDIWWHELIKDVSDDCEPTWIDATEPLFILYTSGSTGKPKGIVHSCGGFLMHTYLASKYLYDVKEGDVFFCTSDLGWIMGHSKLVYAGLAFGQSIILLEGTPTFPSKDRLFEIIDRLEVNVFYTSPTVVRMLMKSGDHYVKAFKRRSLKVLVVSGEAMNREAWLWMWKVVGDGRCSLVDNYAQTETSGPIISSLAGCTPMKPGSVTLPFFGVLPALLDHSGNEITGPGQGELVFMKPWPGLALTICNNHELFESTYFKKYPDYYWTGDMARRDSDGYYWIMGRTDDTLNVSGHLLSTKEIEGAIGEHMAVAEAAVVSAPHSMKGEVPFVFVVLNKKFIMTTDFESEIKNRAREKIGAHAVPDVVLSVSGLPRTRTGKVMRRILYKVVRNDNNFGDTSTMEDESVLNELKSMKF